MTLSDSELAHFLTNIHSIAAVGVNNHPATPPYRVISYQQSQGYDIIPVTSEFPQVLGSPAVSSVGEIHRPVDLVNVFVTGNALSEAVDAAIENHAKGVWLQPGVHDEIAERKLQEAGITCIKDKCFEREHRRLMARKPF